MRSGSRAAGISRRRRQAAVLLLAVLLLPLQGLAQDSVRGQEYRLRGGDTIQVTVPGRPDLEGNLTLDDNGRVPVPQVGEVDLAGLSFGEAARVLRQRLRLVDPSVDVVSVELAAAAALTLHVIGEVAQPGPYSFAQAPSLWRLIRDAGGPLTEADLRQSRVIREEGGRSLIHDLDLTPMMSGGVLPSFELRNGDTLVIPPRTGMSGRGSAAGGVHVFGGVVAPATVSLSGPTPLLDVLMLAGSPLAQSELAKVWLVHGEGPQHRSQLVDMRLFLEQGDPAGNPLVYPGDAVQVTFQKEGWSRRNIPVIVASLAAVGTLWLAIDRSRD